MNLLDSLLVRTLPLVPKTLVRRFAAPYVAGETEAAAVALARQLNQRGLAVTLDVLGEDVTNPAEARAASGAYLALLDAIAAEEIDSNVSLKLSQFGLKLDRKLCFDNLRAVVERAHAQGNFVRIDMEDSSTTDATLEIYRDLRAEFDNVGVVLQACLKRTLGDARALASLKPNVRVCKGIYIEPAAIAWLDRERVRESYMATVETLLRDGSLVGIATHDEVLVAAAETLVADLKLPRRGRYEFQMLLGVRQGLRDEVAGRGHKLRVYVPFGSHWYAYSIRRLRENPAIARYVAKAILFGDSPRRAA
jgi:proline dehydrogenase